jgi:hypothetical protein
LALTDQTIAKPAFDIPFVLQSRSALSVPCWAVSLMDFTWLLGGVGVGMKTTVGNIFTLGFGVGDGLTVGVGLGVAVGAFVGIDLVGVITLGVVVG